jgi:hypothetical protein
VCWIRCYLDNRNQSFRQHAIYALQTAQGINTKTLCLNWSLKIISDLKTIKIRHTDTDNSAPEYIVQSDNSTIAEDISIVEAYFRDIEETIVQKIENADAVVGCVAWLTSHPILDALSQTKYGTSIVVQKEDFLRPDTNHKKYSNNKLHEKYNKLNAIPDYSYGTHEIKDNWLDEAKNVKADISVRCVGSADKNKIAIPRMHHKFLVFVRSSGKYFYPDPYAVWTGSFNMSKNAKLSMENGVYIESNTLAKAYFNEWHNTLMISEELNWSSVEPEPSIQFNYMDANVIP